MSDPFTYHKPNEDQATAMSVINEHYRAAYEWLTDNVKPSAERTLAIRKLQEARMWTNVAILGIELPR